MRMILIMGNAHTCLSYYDSREKESPFFVLHQIGQRRAASSPGFGVRSQAGFLAVPHIHI